MNIPDLPPLPAVLAAIVAALLAGLARGFSGFGSALIFIPLASAALGPRVAAPLLVLVDNLTTRPGKGIPRTPSSFSEFFGCGCGEVGLV
jgi:hypothetical protein